MLPVSSGLAHLQMYGIKFQTGYFIIFFIHLDLLYLHISLCRQHIHMLNYDSSLNMIIVAVYSNTANAAKQTGDEHKSRAPSTILLFSSLLLHVLFLCDVALHLILTQWQRKQRASTAFVPSIYLKIRAANVFPITALCFRFKVPISVYFERMWLLLCSLVDSLLRKLFYYANNVLCF